MQIKNILDSAVLQRTEKNISQYNVYGSCRSTGTLLLTVENGCGIVKNFDKLPIGEASGGKFTGSVDGLPTGGPYKLTFEISSSREKAVVKDVLVGDLWLLAGQSNMADSGYMPSCAESNAMVHAFYMDNHWGEAKEPLHDVMHAAAPVHGGNPENPRTKVLRGTGPGLPFGTAMYKATGVPQGLIACAHGGTSMSQWDPALKKLGGHSLYGALYERLQMLGGRVAGLLWYQGCNETGSDELVASYEKNMKRLFRAFRRDCNDPELPIVFAQLASFVMQTGENTSQVNWLKIRNSQYQLGRTVKNAVCVPTIDLELDDMIHLSNRAVAILGERFADAMLGLRGEKENQLPIEIKQAKCISDKVMNYAKIIVEFKNVQGKLTAPGLPRGFAVIDKTGKVVAEAVNVRLDGNRAIVQTRVPYQLFDKYYQIAYGASLQPCANITDMAGRSLPCAFTNVIRDRRPISEILQYALVSEAVYCDDSFQNLKRPENWEELNYQPARFSNFYLACPSEEGKNVKAHKVYCFKFRAKLAEDMDLDMLFGADASFILYVDNQEFHKQCTCNPVILDEFVLPMKLSAGEHDFCCVFSSNGGCGWGICCRFRRKESKVMPEFVKLW